MKKIYIILIIVLLFLLTGTALFRFYFANSTKALVELSKSSFQHSQNQSVHSYAIDLGTMDFRIIEGGAVVLDKLAAKIELFSKNGTKKDAKKLIKTVMICVGKTSANECRGREAASFDGEYALFDNIGSEITKDVSHQDSLDFLVSINIEPYVEKIEQDGNPTGFENGDYLQYSVIIGKPSNDSVSAFVFGPDGNSKQKARIIGEFYSEKTNLWPYFSKNCLKDGEYLLYGAQAKCCPDLNEFISGNGDAICSKAK